MLIALLLLTCFYLAPNVWAQSLGVGLKLDPNTRSVRAYVEATVPVPPEQFTCTFLLPNEIAPVSKVIGQRGSVVVRMERQAKAGVGIVSMAKLFVTPDATGYANFSYTLSVGNQLGTAQSGRFGPHYGYSDGERLAISRKLVVPRCTSPSESKAFIPMITSVDGAGHGKGVSSGPRAVDVDEVFVAGTFNEAHIGKDGGLIARSVRQISPATLTYIEKMLMVMAPVIRKTERIPDITIVGDKEGETYYALSGTGMVVTDAEPMTPERAMRLGRVFAAQTLVNQLHDGLRVPADELWLMYSLPPYYAARAAAKSDLINFDQDMYDRREDYIADRNKYDAIGNLGRQTDPNLREEVGYTLGVILLNELNGMLEAEGSSLDRVVERVRLRSFIWSFKNALALELGPIKAYRWWNQNVRTSEPKVYEGGRLLLMKGSESTTQTQSAFFLTSGLFGHLELCGCKRNQAGGAARRLYFMAQSPIRRLDLGNFLAGPTLAQASDTDKLEINAQIALMESSRYSAIAIGPNELPFLDVLAKSGLKTALVSANSSDFQPFKLIPFMGADVAVVGWSDIPVLQRYESRSWLSISDKHVTFAPDRLYNILDQLQHKSTRVIVIGNVHPVTIQHIVQRYPNIEAIASSYSVLADLPSSGFYRSTYIVLYSGDQGATVAELLNQSTTSHAGIVNVKTSRMQTDLKEDGGIRFWLDRFFNSLEYRAAALSDERTMGLSQYSPHATGERIADSSFVGTESCHGCHNEEYKHWTNTAHATAMKSLIQKHRDHTPVCVGCHAVGFREVSGYNLARPNPQLENVGCEVCHGQGLLHIRNPSSSNIHRAPSREVCVTCHSPEHSDFAAHPDQYWSAILHRKPTLTTRK